MEYSPIGMTVILDGLTFETVDFNIKHRVAPRWRKFAELLKSERA